VKTHEHRCALNGIRLTLVNGIRLTLVYPAH